MRNLSLTTAILIISLSLLSGAEKQAQTAPDQAVNKTAEVVFIIRDRVYINIGTLAEINTDWKVDYVAESADILTIPLAWCGEDLSYFEFPDLFFSVGDQIELFYHPNIPSKNYRITLAYPRMPALPHETQVDIYDFEFSGLLADRFMNQKLEFKIDTIAGDIEYFSITPKNILFKSTGEPAKSSDLQYGLENHFLAFNVNYYLLSKVFPGLGQAPSIDSDETNAEVYFLGNDQKALSLVHNINSYIIHILSEMRTAQNMDTGENVTRNWVDLSSLRDTTLTGYKISTGPYYFENKDDGHITLLRNKYYSSDNGYPDTLIIKIIPDYLERKLAFQLGQIDYLDINYTDRDQFQDDYEIVESNTELGLFLSANSLKDYLNDGMLTAALSYFINRESLCQVALGGMAEALTAPACLLKDNSVEPYSYDPGKGRELLRNAGAIPKYLSLYIKPDNFITRRAAEYIKGLLARQNIYLTIYSDKDFQPTLSPEQFQEFDLMLSYIDLSSEDPLVVMNQITFHYGMTDIRANKSLYFADEFDALAKDYLWDADTSTSKLLNYFQILREIPAGIFLLKPRRLTVLSNRLTGFEFKPDGTVDFSRIEPGDEPKK